ncbi:MAG: hypothetical protein WBL21_09795 [Salinimicrobium sp.]
MTTVSLAISNLIPVLKFSFQLAFMTIEVILTFYSDVLEDSLMIKFLFFVISAVLIAMAVTKLASNILPEDKDFVSAEEEAGND